MKQVRVKIGERWYTVEVEEPLGSPARVTVEGETFLVEVDRGVSRRSHSRTFRPPVGAPAARGGAGGQSAAADGIIKSPMSGKVLAIRVKPGGKVVSGEEVCVVEAMKMEQSIRSPQNGVVKEIRVQPMDSVRTNDPLMELE